MGSEKRCDALGSNSRVNCARTQKITEAPQKPDARTPPGPSQGGVPRTLIDEPDRKAEGSAEETHGRAKSSSRNVRHGKPTGHRSWKPAASNQGGTPCVSQSAMTRRLLVRCGKSSAPRAPTPGRGPAGAGAGHALGCARLWSCGGAGPPLVCRYLWRRQPSYDYRGNTTFAVR
jgi:hypothetical protein